MSRVARRAGLGRESLYKALAGTASRTILRVAAAMGYTFEVRAALQIGRRRSDLRRSRPAMNVATRPAARRCPRPAMRLRARSGTVFAQIRASRPSLASSDEPAVNFRNSDCVQDVGRRRAGVSVSDGSGANQEARIAGALFCLLIAGCAGVERAPSQEPPRTATIPTEPATEPPPPVVAEPPATQSPPPGVAAPPATPVPQAEPSAVEPPAPRATPAPPPPPPEPVRAPTPAAAAVRRRTATFGHERGEQPQSASSRRTGQTAGRHDDGTRTGSAGLESGRSSGCVQAARAAAGPGISRNPTS